MAEADLRLLLRTVADTSGAEKTSEALRRVQQTTTQTNTSMVSMARWAAASAAGFVSVASAASALGSVFTASINAQRENERVTRATAAAYGVTAQQFERFASSLSAQTGFTSQAILEAALSARTLSANYGLSVDQTQNLIRASADLARVRGIGVAEAFERVQSAIRGEAEASEYLGLTLNDTFIKNNALNGSVRTTFERMTDAQKAQIRYDEVLRQTAVFKGLATTSINSLDGAMLRAESSANRLAIALGKVAAPATVFGLDAMSQLMKDLGISLEQLQTKPSSTLVEIIEAIRAGTIQPSVARRQLAAAELEQAAALYRPSAAGQSIRGERPSVSGAFATERAAFARQEERTLRQIALADQVEAAVRDITSAQRVQLDLQRQSVDLAAQEAQLRLSMLPAQQRMAELQRQMTEQQIAARRAALPATEALEDLRFEQQRAQLVAGMRGIPVEERVAARRQLREIGRALPGAELAALEAGRRVTLTERGATRLGMDQQLFDISTQRQLEQIQGQQTANGYLAQIAAQRSQAIELTINMSSESFQTEVFKQLVEAEKQAQGPTTIKLSGVRR